MFKNYFYFDIETTSKYIDITEFEKMDKRGYDLFVKKKDMMFDYDEKWTAPLSRLYVDKAPILPEYGKIICMSFGMFVNDKLQIRTIIDDDEEKLLNTIKGVLDKVNGTNKRLCGFSIKSFDIPWIVRKMYKYNIQLPHSIDFSGLKPWEIGVVDVYDIWKGSARLGASLDEVAYDLGIDSPKKKMSGKDIHSYYWLKKDKASIIEYCESDITCLVDIASKLKI